MATKKLASRLAGVIASIAEQHGVPCRGEDRLEILGAIKIDIPLTILDLASIVGNSREPVNRALTTMRKSGLVVRDRRDR
jgi:CRP-like cAMP-binding protein